MKTWAIAIAALGFTATSATAADVSRRPFGTMPDGTPVEAITRAARDFATLVPEQ